MTRDIAVRLRGALLLSIFAGAAPAGAGGSQPEWLRFGAMLGSVPEAEPSLREPPLVAPDNGAQNGSEQLLDRWEIRLAPGVVLERELRVVRFLTAEAAQRQANLVFSVRASHEDDVIEHAFVQQPSGERIAVDPKTIQIRDAYIPDVFSDVYDVSVPMPAVVPGSIAVLDVRRRFRSADWPLPWSRLIPMQSDVALRRTEIVVEWDASVPAPIVTSDRRELHCESVAPQRMECSAGPIAAIELDPDLSELWDSIGLAVVAEPTSWSELATSYAALIDAQIGDGDPEIAATANQLLAGITAPMDRIRRLHQFVANEVRYVGLEHGASAVIPHPARDTLRRRYGDCKDKVTLFLALARAAGIDAWPVLVTTQFSTPAKLLTPGWRWFDHMIACVKGTCIDLTAPRMPTGEIPVEVQGRVAFDIAKGSSGPRVLDAPLHAYEVRVESHYDVGCDGSYREKLRRIYPGTWGSNLRGHLLALSTEQRRQWLEQEYKEGTKLEQVPEFQVENLEDPSEALAITSTLYLPGASPLAATPFSDRDPWLTEYVVSMQSKNHNNAYRMRGMHYSGKTEYQLCTDFAPRFLGPELDFTARFGRLQRHYERTDDAVAVTTEFSLPRARLDGAERESFNRFLDRALGQSRVWFTIAPRR